jgi:beta-lactam-binding protein with PASTA domain
VTVFVSSGAISVPDVIGDARRAAVTELKRAGFVVAVNEQPTTDQAQSNRVTNQFPPAGSRGQRGDTVTITVGVFEAPPPPVP